MSMVEINLKLFITCRLCLEESGTYQILPAVQELIKYCFDITVEPFDGLPQLICKKCQSILSDYSKTKTLFVQKQDELKKKILKNNIQIEKNVNAAPFEKDNNDNSKINKKRKISSSSSKTDSKCKINFNKDLVTQNIVPKIENNALPITQEWETNYRKTFVCRLCSSSWFTWRSLMFHAARHNVLKNKHNDIFRKYCTVTLPKIDSKPNLTGSMDKLVYSKDIILSKGNADYYIAYKKYTGNISSGEEEIVKPIKGFKFDESSDSASERVVRRKRKRKRISSRSSNDTVVIEESNVSGRDESDNRSQKENECISIDDTDSDDENTKLTIKEKLPHNEEDKAKVLKELITATTSRFAKKYEKPPKHTSSFGQQLKRKFLSLGRKIINRPGFNCNGVVKFLENVNLDLIWLSRSPLNLTSSSNYLKIIARLKNTQEKNLNYFEGYTKKYDKRKEGLYFVPSLVNQWPTLVLKGGQLGEQKNHVDENGFAGNVSQDQKYSIQDTNAENTASSKAERAPPEVHGLSVSTQSDAAMLYTINPADTQKLLNANPVANPKQLPKKFISTEVKLKSKYNTNIPSLEIVVGPEVYEGHDEGMQMPIITSTTSLAVPQTKIPGMNNSNTNTNNQMASPYTVNQKPTIPRIKVKSVAELMSKDALNRMNEPSTIVIENEPVIQNSVYAGPQNKILSSASRPNNVNDYVILDTVELPNTKTFSPFLYFKSLLAVHNITLLDTEATLSGEFHTLIKFKVLYNQETKDHVVLHLSLYCVNNIFCLKVKDRNEDNINMTKISANWQWEILKIFRGEVVTKLLCNAQKISQEVYDYTNSFLCLLKSINFITK